jgi:hypothetical protein
MHALPRHPGPRRGFRHRDPDLDLEHSAVPLLDNRHLHQRQSRPPVTNARKRRGTGKPNNGTRKPCGGTMSSIYRDRTSRSGTCRSQCCRIEPYLIKAAPLRGTAGPASAAGSALRARPPHAGPRAARSNGLMTRNRIHYAGPPNRLSSLQGDAIQRSSAHAAVQEESSSRGSSSSLRTTSASASRPRADSTSERFLIVRATLEA